MTDGESSAITAPDPITDTAPPAPPEDTRPAKPRRSRSRKPPAATDAPAPRRSRKAAVVSRSRADREQQALQLLTLVGLGLSARDHYDGATVLAGAPALAQALAQLAEEQPAIARALDALAAGGSIGAVLAATAAIVLPIAARHRLVPVQIGQLGGALNNDVGAYIITEPAYFGAPAPAE